MFVKLQKGPFHTYLMQVTSANFDTRNGTVKLYGIKDGDIVTLNGLSDEEFDTLCLNLATCNIVNLFERGVRYG